MAGKDMIWMSLREVKRLKVVQSAIAKQTTQRTAALMLGLSERQVPPMGGFTQPSLRLSLYGQLRDGY
jgi:hypothetical protein